MSFVYRQQIPARNTNTNDSTGATASASLPSTAIAGNILIWTAYTNSGTSLAINGTGATKAYATDLIPNNTGAARFNMWWKVAAGTEKTYTLTVTGGSPTITRFHIYEFSRLATTVTPPTVISATGTGTALATAAQTKQYYDEFFSFSSIGYTGNASTFTNASGGLYTYDGNGMTTTTETQLADYWYIAQNTDINAQQMKVTRSVLSGAWAMGTLTFVSNPYSATINVSLNNTGTYTIVGGSSSGNYPTLGVG
jgi:hypothetical protein